MPSYSLYEMVYLITNILATYTIYLLMKVFFDEIKSSNLFEFITYLAYYLISSYLYLEFKIPILMLVTNLILFFIITLNYKSKILNRILVVVYIYLFLFILEILIGATFGIIKFDKEDSLEFHTIYILIAIKLITFVIALVVTKFIKVKNGESIPLLYWISIVSIPIATLYVLLIFLSTNNLNRQQIIRVVSVMMFINFIVFYLYDKIIFVMDSIVKQREFESQSEYYKNELELIKNNMEHFNKFKHDLKNHLVMKEALIKNGSEVKYENYLDDLLDEIDFHQKYCDSGNVDLDCIINYKLEEIEKLNVDIDVKINIPDSLDISTYTITTILGNLLDNAIAGLKTTNNSRKIIININYNKKVLLIEINNTFDGEIKELNGKILSSKRKNMSNGIGIDRVRNEVAKYNGDMFMSTTANMFCVSVIMDIKIKQDNMK